MRPTILFGSGCLFSSMSVINYLISTSIFRPVAWGTFYTIGNYAKIIEFLNFFFYSSFNRMECLHFLRLPHIPTSYTMWTLYLTNHADCIRIFVPYTVISLVYINRFINIFIYGIIIINCRTLLCKYNVYLQFRSSCANDSIFVDYVIDVHVYIYI